MQGRLLPNDTRVQPGLQRRGLGPALLDAGEQWAQARAPYLTGLIKTSNAPSMKMVTALGWETAARFDYLVLELARFDGMAEPGPSSSISTATRT